MYSGIFAFLCVLALRCTRETSPTFRGTLNCTDLSKMDQLPTDQQGALRKTNTERLRTMATKTYDAGDEELETMDRTALLEVVARDIVSRRGATSRRRSEKSDQVREMELQLELKRMEVESKKTEKKAELERKRLELQNEREHELRLAEAGRLAEGGERDDYDDHNAAEDGGEQGAHEWNLGVHGWRLWQIV